MCSGWAADSAGKVQVSSGVTAKAVRIKKRRADVHYSLFHTLGAIEVGLG